MKTAGNQKMAEIIHLNVPFSLLGRWRQEWDSDDARSEYEIEFVGNDLRVTGIDHVDGEKVVISNVAYDRDYVEFDTLMASTGRRGHLVLRRRSSTDVEMSFTFTDVYLAFKVDSDV